SSIIMLLIQQIVLFSLVFLNFLKYNIFLFCLLARKDQKWAYYLLLLDNALLNRLSVSGYRVDKMTNTLTKYIEPY
ncbi:hypothetical protein, partial [Gilliamella sp. B3892]|uniref:hypothetical protein n=1 Tax=Gilliamella sp. B3892 TaxID=2818016 RepID=UPI00226A4D2E